MAHTKFAEPERAVAESKVVRSHTPGWHEARDLVAQLGLRYSRAPRWASASSVIEEVPLADAAGRILAADVTAVADLPRFATAAMDGWVLSSCEPTGLTGVGDGAATGWTVETGIAAGDIPSSLPLLPGTARPISTGAPVPCGAAAVLRSEFGEISVDRVGLRGRTRLRSTHPVRVNEHIRPSGEEARQGETLLHASDTLTPPRIALAAAAGRDTLLVLRRPSVELLLLGDELAQSGHPRGGQVRDALGPAVPPIVAALGLAMGRARYVPDDLAATVAAVMSATADVVITTGGSSHGTADHVRGALQALGARPIFDGVAMRPGHPVMLAELTDGRPLLCLPGNPLAALVCLISFAGPLADALLARSPRPLGLSTVATDLPNATDPTNATDLPNSTDLPNAIGTHNATGLLNATASTRLIACRQTAHGVVPVDWQGSGMMRGLAYADVLAIVPPGGTCAGEPVQTIPLPW